MACSKRLRIPLSNRVSFPINALGLLVLEVHSFICFVLLLPIETLRNRTAGRFRTAEWLKNVAQDRECTVSSSRDIFSSFCRPESSSRHVAWGLFCTSFTQPLPVHTPSFLLGGKLTPQGSRVEKFVQFKPTEKINLSIHQSDNYLSDPQKKDSFPRKG